MTTLLHRVALVASVALLSMPAPAASPQPDEASLRAADAEELRIVQERDVTAERQFLHPNYLVNSPANRVVAKDQLIKLLSAGQIANDGLERTVEATSITGNVGIVMGHETVKPKSSSELGRLYGTRPLERRYTNVFLFETGKWRLLARQSTVIDVPPQQ